MARKDLVTSLNSISSALLDACTTLGPSSRDLRQHKKTRRALDLGLPRSLVNMFSIVWGSLFHYSQTCWYHRDHLSLRLVKTDSLKGQSEAGFCAFTSDNCLFFGTEAEAEVDVEGVDFATVAGLDCDSAGGDKSSLIRLT